MKAWDKNDNELKVGDRVRDDGFDVDGKIVEIRIGSLDQHDLLVAWDNGTTWPTDSQEVVIVKEERNA